MWEMAGMVLTSGGFVEVKPDQGVAARFSGWGNPSPDGMGYNTQNNVT